MRDFLLGTWECFGIQKMTQQHWNFIKWNWIAYVESVLFCVMQILPQSKKSLAVSSYPGHWKELAQRRIKEGYTWEWAALIDSPAFHLWFPCVSIMRCHTDQADLRLSSDSLLLPVVTLLSSILIQSQGSISSLRVNLENCVLVGRESGQMRVTEATAWLWIDGLLLSKLNSS